MKRGILLIVFLFLLTDLTVDGYLGNVRSGPLQGAVGTSLSDPPDSPSRQVDYCHASPPLDWRVIFPLGQFQTVIPTKQLVFKIIYACHHGSSGGIPQ